MSVEHWSYDGIVLNVDDKGEVPVEDLKAFLAHAEAMGAPIRLYEYGLRVTRLRGEGGPRLDWRD